MKKDLCIPFDEKQYFIRKTYHLLEKRGESKFARDHFITDKNYLDICKMALINGLQSFRNKGQVVITFKAEKRDIFYGLLLELDETNNITLITTFHTFSKFWKMFHKVPNRINLLGTNCNYLLPDVSKSERAKKELDITGLEITKENTNISFKELMSYYVNIKF